MSAPMGAQPLDKLIIEDHNKVRYLFSEYKKAPVAEMKQQLAYQIIRELSMHSSKEEEVWYPLLGKVLGQERLAHAQAEHQRMKELLQAINDLDADKELVTLDAKVRELEGAFTHHAMEEESKELPAFLQSPEVDGTELGRKFEAAAAHAVTRPHPWVPAVANRGLMGKFAHMATAPLDAAADAIRFAGNVPTVNPPR